MEGMEKISEAVLNKIKADARKIIGEAESKRQSEITLAEKRRDAKHEETKRKMVEDSQREAAKITSQASLKSQQALLDAKFSIINEIIDGTRDSISSRPTEPASLYKIIKEAVAGVTDDKLRVYVAAKDIAIAQDLIKDDRQLAARIIEIREYDCLGGAIIEDLDSKFRIDNTYETRLEMLMPKLLPDISKQIFEVKI
jgi:vacuolar-type H+-ATPase subunit E/Vma4